MRNNNPRTLLIGLSLLTGFLTVVVFSWFFWLTNSGLIIGYSLLAGLILGLITYLLSYLFFGSYLKSQMKTVFKNLNRARGLSKSEPESLLNHNVFYRLNHELMKWSEETKEQIEELRKAENYRREFVGNVSHELKTPIFNIQGYVHTLLEGGIDDAAINKKYLEKAVKNIERLSAIVEDLEAISQLETGELKLSFERFDLKRLSNDVIESLEITANERHISLNLEPKHQGSVLAKGDIGRIRQVLTNLLSNSIKYGKEGGQTTIQITEGEEDILVTISDNGIGIDPKHLPRLFERFYRVDKSRSREQGGTGLGLSIVKHILEAHGKKIDVQSEPGVGTTFSFKLDKP